MNITDDMPDIAIIGAGVNEYQQLTREGEIIIDNSELAIINTISQHTSEVLKKKENLETINLQELYLNKINENNHMSEKEQTNFTCYHSVQYTLEQAKQREGTVSYITKGHPCYYSDSCEWIYRLSGKWGLETKIIPSVSSMDAVMAKLNIDYAGGTYQIGLRKLLSKTPDLPEETTLGIWLMNCITQKDNLEKLKSYLIEQYNPNKRMYLFRLKNDVFGRDETMETKIKNLSDLNANRIRGKTSIIPNKRAYNVNQRLSEALTQEMADNISSGEVREDHSLSTEGTHYPDNPELKRLIQKTYLDDEFYSRLIKNPEKVINEFDIDEEIKSHLLNNEQGIKALNISLLNRSDFEELSTKNDQSLEDELT